MTGTADPAAIQQFRANMRSAYELMKFDRFVLEIAIGQLRRMAERQDTAGITNASHRPERIIRNLENIRNNDSLKPHYERMVNQCLVLVVAYFSSAVRQIFLQAAERGFRDRVGEGLLKQDFELTVGQLRDAHDDLAAFVAAALADRKEISFQDMQSIRNAFRKFFSVELDRDERMNNVIAALACRHLLVHTDGNVTDRLLNQLATVRPRALKPELVLGERLQFTQPELKAVGKDMLAFLRDLTDRLSSAGLALP